MTAAGDHRAPPSGRLGGRVAIVAGCSPSINAGIAGALADEGAAVACFDRDPDFSDACARWLKDRGGRAVSLVGDVGSEDDVRRCVSDAQTAFGGVDIVVNGAAVESWTGLLDCSLDDFRRHLDVIVCGAFLMTKHAAAAMIGDGRRGAVVNLGSTEGHQGRPGNVAYGTAKGAVLHMTKSLAMELAPHGIRVNSITPTGTAAAQGEQRAREWGVRWQPAAAPRRPDFSNGDAGVPLGRRPTPDDYGRAAAFLVSPDADSITGIDLRVDGGVVSRYWRWSPENS